ncbi:MAG: ABC transporter permease [Oscillospiraceae bacterium]|nr:ABC transporter permease [Oscillospiraceae bacterium]
MGKYIVKRILWLIPITLLVIVFVYTILFFAPVDRARAALGMGASEQAIAEFNEKNGLDKGYLGGLIIYLKNLLHGDFGVSYYTSVSVSKQILVRLPYTVKLAILATTFGVVIGLPLGILAATHQNSWLDSLTMALTMFFSAMPTFWFALILVMIFSLHFRWLPSVGYESWKNYVMPVVSIGLHVSAIIARQARASTLEVIRSDYVTTARAKGQKESKIISDHVLRNGSIPVITVAGGNLAAMMGGALLIEQIFTIPGIGTYLFSGIASLDIPVVLGCVTMLSVFHGLIIVLVDIIYTFVDPRMKVAIIQNSAKKKILRGGETT